MSGNQTPHRTQAERTRLSREKIIRAAVESFARAGFRGAKMADIAAAAGLTVPGLLHHFPSKTHLLMAVLAERDRADRERFDPALRGGALPSFQELVEYNQTVPGLVQLFTTLVAESIQEAHPSHDFFVRRYHSGRERDMEDLRQAQAKGDIRTDVSAEDLVVMLYAMMDGLQVQWLLEPDEIDMARVFGQFVKVLKGG
jgi:AcrR family transcriptional regulator